MKKKCLFLIFLFFTIYSNAQYLLNISDKKSLVRTGMDPHPIDNDDIKIAYTFLNALNKSYIDSILFVSNYYESKSDLTKTKTYSSLSWICKKLYESKVGKPLCLTNPLESDLYCFFIENNYENLKHYLVLKYELNNYKPKSLKEHIVWKTYYDDLLMFNDPLRKKWDNFEEMRNSSWIKKGEKVIDVGCGFGYNTFMLNELVGKSGKIFASDVDSLYVVHLKNVIQKSKIKNIIPIQSKSNDISVKEPVDALFFSSLYHIIYTWSREDERVPFLISLKKALKPNGYLIIIDNNNLYGNELNNCHIDYRLIEAQLEYWGFKKIEYKRLSNQRYLLVFENVDPYPTLDFASISQNKLIKVSDSLFQLSIATPKSIIHIGSLDSYDITDKGIECANFAYQYFTTGIPEYANTAIKKYNELIPNENFGGEYSAIQWILKTAIANDSLQKIMLADPMSRSYFNYLTENNYAIISYYVLHKYKLGSIEERSKSDSILEINGEVGRTKRSFLEDYILALNPVRPLWENTNKILDNLQLKSGELIADIGSGSGYFSYRFSKIVGNNGKVFSTELRNEHIERLKDFCKPENINNIFILKGAEDKLELPEKVDKMFLCSLYHVLYGVIADNTRDNYLKSLVNCLKPEGELIIVDNCPVEDSKLPYHGPYISKELIISQLFYYGLECTDFVQIIPQRYMLKFKKNKS